MIKLFKLYRPTRWSYAIILLGVILAVVMMAIYSYRAIDLELTESVLSRRASVSSLAAAVLSEKFDRLVDIGISLTSHVRFRELVEDGNWIEAGKILSSVPADFPLIDRITLHDMRGTLMADVPPAPEVRGRNFADRDWYQGVMRTGKPYISRVYRRAALPQRNVFVAAVPIKSSTGEMLGILVVQVRSDTFFGWIKDVDTGPGGFIYVVDQRGILASHPKYPPQGDLVDYSSVPVVQRVLQKNHGVEIEFNPVESEKGVVAYAPIAKHGWGVVLAQPTATVFAAKDDQLRRVQVAYGLALIFIACVVFLVFRIAVQRRQADEDRRVKAQLEHRVAVRTEQLEATNKELESFSYSVSHDLRTPLRAISGYTRMLEEDHGARLDEDAKRCLTVVRKEAGRMAELIDDLLAFSRLGREHFKATAIDMMALVQEVAGELRPAAVPATQIEVDSLPPASGDRATLRQVWVNLIGNAIKFSGKCDQPRVRISGKKLQVETVYRIEDNGAGFDMRYYNKLFGVFQRLHGIEEFPGTGIGLAIVQRVVARHRGRVWAESEPGRGAVFYFSLPNGANDNE